MAKWLTSFVLLAVMTSSSLAGTPLHSGEHECSMSEMPDCCETARAQSDTPEAAMAQLCCTINCTQTGTAAPSGTLKIRPALPVVSLPATTPRPGAQLNIALVRDKEPPEHQQHSPPTYIRHLALLI